MFDIAAFVVFPYIALTLFVAGFIYRYFSAPFNWNAKSSELLDKGSLRWGAMIFHYGIFMTLFGHAGGMLIPQSLFDFFGFSGEAHTRVSIVLGIPFGILALFGVLWLTWRRLSRTRVRVHSSVSDWVVLLLLLLVIGFGFRNVLIGHYYILDTIAPWIRGIVTFHPDAGLMKDVPLAYKLHVLGAFTFFAFSPFSRMVHAWSYPFTYLVRSFIVYRRTRTLPEGQQG